MTGFGQAAFDVGGVRFDIEARSVNHRHLDLRFRLPRLLSTLEAEARDCVQERASRGKIDITVSTVEGSKLLQQLEIDREAAREYARAAQELEREAGVVGPLTVDALLALPGVAGFSERDLPAEELSAGLRGALAAAIEELDEMRVREGAALERDLLERLESVVGLSESLAARSEVVREAARERLHKRTQQLELETGIVDEARLHHEIVLAADRLDVTEEIVRLRSHVDQFREIVSGAAAGVPVGRRLDFLMQEFGREANTIGSKGNDSPIAHQVVELKTEIERMREQVQNVE
ncbi:MAG: YicC family protein [Deltaproteobacteria bacterium]|nr:YicC family protein [Deltaproteobacteria bacterium]